MSDIKIRRTHSLSHDKARSAAEKMAKRLQKEFDLDCEWDGDVLVFERSGVNGELTVAARHVEMEVKLGFMLKMMKPTIEKHIHANLDQIFAEQVTEKSPDQARASAVGAGKPQSAEPARTKAAEAARAETLDSGKAKAKPKGV